MDAIDIRGLKKYYGRSPGIEDVTFSVRQGEVFGFIGPNGAGKSTTIRLLLNMLFPTAGSATILGHDVVRQSREIKRFTGYVPSDVRLYKDMTTDELLSVTAGFHGMRSGGEADRLCSLLEVDRRKRFRTLSTGNRKKVAIVSALQVNPKVLILDEPTAGLDPIIQKRLFIELKARAAQGLTVLFSSHNLAQVEEYCDRVAIIKAGRIVTVSDGSEPLHKIVTLWGGGTAFDRNDEATLLEQHGQKRIYRFRGNAGELLQALAQSKPDDFTVAYESLEERFLSVYGEEVPR